MIEQHSPSAITTVGWSGQPPSPTAAASIAVANTLRIRRGRRNVNRNTASIPPRISLKTGRGKSPNTGTLQFYVVEKPDAFVSVPGLGLRRGWRENPKSEQHQYTPSHLAENRTRKIAEYW